MKPENQLITLRNALVCLPGQPITVDEGGYTFTYPSGKEVEWRFEEKLTTPVVERLLLQKREEPFLVLSPYISPIFAERLRKHGVFFVDETGNAFLEWPGYYLFVAREIPKRQRPDAGGAKRKDFPPNALKLLFAFLTDEVEGREALLNQTVRQLNARTGVSTGSISGILDSLKAQGHIEERDPGVRGLLQREKLFERWVQDYGRKLRPKLVSEHYRLPQPGWAEELLKVEAPGLWGGEVAGARLTGYLVPETVTIYSVGLPADFIVRHDLRKDPAGKVEVLRPFWPESHPPSFQGCVHPLIVYADLMATEIDRNLETAKRIYEQYLRPMASSD